MTKEQKIKEFVRKLADGKFSRGSIVPFNILKCEQDLKSLMDSKWISVDKELERAEKLHPDYPVDMFQQLAIMNKEAGEVTKAVLHYWYENGSLDNIKKELTQTMAMCKRMLNALPQPPKEK